MNGDLERLDGNRWRLRFERELRHPVARVWEAVTEEADLRAWFPQRIVGDLLTAGADLQFEDPSHGVSFPGEVLAVEAPRLLEFRWGTDRIRLEIAARPGGCRLTLLDTIDELGKAARDGAGWHVCLDALATRLGEGPAFAVGERWREVHERYVERFGPDASTIGPPASRS